MRVILTVSFFCFLLRLTATAQVTENKSRELRSNGMQFVENKGQIIDMNNRLRPDIKYIGDGGSAKVYLRDNGISYVLRKGEREDVPENEDHPVSERSQRGLSGEKSEAVKLHRVDMDFVGCNENPVILGKNKTQQYFNYYLSHCPNGITADAYNKVVYQNIYPNIDIVFYGEKESAASGGIKYDFIIRPGGNSNDIQLNYKGAHDLRVINETQTRDGKNLAETEVKISTSLGDLTEQMPKVYQNINGKIIDVKADYVLQGTTIHFKLGSYNSKFSLTIDPWMTYYGGEDVSMGITTDQNGNPVVIGKTFQNAFPATPGAFQTVNASPGQSDAFVVKFDPDGNPLWATYYGGSSFDYGYAIATDLANNIVITGHTESLALPMTAGNFQTTYYGYSDAFIVKFNSAGAVQWATYFGGSGDIDDGNGIVTDASNNIIVAGTTQSSDLPFTVGAFQTALGGGIVGHGSIATDAYVAKFGPGGNRLWATYYGGYGPDGANDVAIDAGDNIAFAGTTGCLNFPFTAGAFQTALNCVTVDSVDAFIVKFDPNGNRTWATYYGGGGWDKATDMDIDRADNIIVTGNTYSSDFPVSIGAFQTLFGGGTDDDFIIKLDPNGNRLWGTYYGLALDEMECYCSTDQNNNIYIFSEWEEGGASTNPGYVLNCAYQKNFGGLEDQFITKFSPAGNQLCTTYLGGGGEDELDNQQGGIVCYGPFIYMTVFTNGLYPVTPGAFQTNYPGTGSFVVGKICSWSCGDTLLLTNFTASQSQVCANSPVNFISNLTRPSCDVATTSYEWTFSNGNPASSTDANPTDITYSTPGNYPVKLKIITPCETDSVVKTMTVVAAPVAAISGNNNICPGSSVLLSASGGGTYSWSTGVATTTINPTPTSNTTYTLVATIGTCSATAVHSISLTITAFAAVTGNTVVCAGGAVILTASGGSTYSWNTTGVTTGTINSVPTGNTTYTLFATSGLCKDTVTHSVNIQALPTASITGNTVVCTGDIILLTASGGGTYSWNTTATTTVINQTSGGSGIASFSVVVSNAALCKDTATINITINPLPQISFTGNTSICIGDSAMITASGGSNYFWSTGSNTANATLHPTSTGSSIYNLTVTGANGCVKDSAVTITVNSIPIANAGLDDTICSGEIATLIASGGGSYSWNNGPATAAQNISPPITTSYTVIVANGNCTDLDSAKVVVNLAPVANTGSNVNILPGQSTTLSASGGGTYYWSPSTGLICNTCAQSIATPSQTTKYYITVTDPNGCTSMDSVLVTLDILCKDLFIPNVFSPNDDGENDVFHIYGTCIKSAHLVIYDRWGEKIFETNNVTAGWNGIYKGKLMNAAVFTYIYTAELDNGESINTKGNITLLK